MFCRTISLERLLHNFFVLSPTGGATKGPLFWYISGPALTNSTQSQVMIYHIRIRPRDLEDDILSAFMPQLPRCIVYLLYIANRLICCSLSDMKEESGAKVKPENNLQGDRSFNDLKNKLFLVSSLAQVVKEQITVLGQFGVRICITFWVEVNVNKVYTCRKRLFSWRWLHTFNIVFKNVPPFVIFSLLLRNPGDGPDCSKRYCD